MILEKLKRLFTKVNIEAHPVLLNESGRQERNLARIARLEAALKDAPRDQRKKYQAEIDRRRGV